ncbi:Glutathione S-transferase [Minicystis rosea]|nr:Glutathione S-transferase [Minicystis rosea]
MNTSPLKLFYAPGVCSLAPHIALRELGVPFDLVRVDLRTKKTADGVDFNTVTPKSYVPLLVLEDGSLLSETAVILRYLADSQPDAQLAPPPGTMARVRFDELLQFIATELHKGFAPFTVMPNVGEDSKRWATTRLTSRVAFLQATLGSNRYLNGDTFTIADAYAYFALRIFSKVVKVELEAPLRDYMGRLTERPSVRSALEAEGVTA